MDYITRISLLTSLICLSVELVVGRMQISSLTSDSPSLSIPGSTVTLHCTITNMDPSNFMQYGKLLPSDQTVRVVFSTNLNIEQSLKNVERYSVTAEMLPSNTSTQTNGGAGGGVDLKLKISDIRLEDAGIYFCTIPSLDLIEYIEVSVFAEPQGVDLYVDNVKVSDRTHVTFQSSVNHHIRCQARGSFPQAIFYFTLGSDVGVRPKNPMDDMFGPSADMSNVDKFVETHTTSHQVVTLPLPSYPEFFAHTTYTTTAVIENAYIDYSMSGRQIMCTAKIPGWKDAKSVSTSFIPIFTGWAPEFSCSRYVMASPSDHEASVRCVISARPKLDRINVYYIDPRPASQGPPGESEADKLAAEIHKNLSSSSSNGPNILDNIRTLYSHHSPQQGGPGGTRASSPSSRRIRATGQRGRGDGAKNEVEYEYYVFNKDVDDDDEEEKLYYPFDSDIDDDKKKDNNNNDNYKVTVTKKDEESTVVELKVNTEQEGAFRDYHFVAANTLGTALHVVTFLQDPVDAQALQASGGTQLNNSISLQIFSSLILFSFYLINRLHNTTD